MEVKVIDYSGGDCSLGVTVGPGNVLLVNGIVVLNTLTA